MDIQTIFNHAPVLLFSKDKENRFIKVNKHTAELWGTTPKLLEGKTCYDLLPEVEATRLHKDDLEVISTGLPKKNIIESITTEDGFTRWFRTDKVPYKDKSGNIIGIVGFAFDVTDQLKTQEELLIIKKAIEQTSSTIAITNAEGILTYVNKKFTETTGYTYDEAIGQNPKVLKSNKMEETTYKNLWATISKGHSWRGEFINKSKNGKLYWELATITPIINDQGVITHYVKVAEVLSDQKHSMLNMWNMFEYSSYYILMLDINMNIKVCNNVLAHILGFDEYELVGKDWKAFVPNDTQNVIMHVHDEIMKGNEGYKEFTNEIITSTGELQTVKWFNSWINHETEWVFCFGVPIKSDAFVTESIDTMRARYKDIITIHRAIIDEFKTKKYQTESKKKT